MDYSHHLSWASVQHSLENPLISVLSSSAQMLSRDQMPFWKGWKNLQESKYHEGRQTSDLLKLFTGAEG